jgi:hypothetical protein
MELYIELKADRRRIIELERLLKEKDDEIERLQEINKAMAEDANAQHRCC